MLFPIPEKYIENIKKIGEVISRNHSFLLTTHQGIDGDGFGCELAFLSLLKSMEKKCVVVNDHSVPELYMFLPGAKEVLLPKRVTASFSPQVIIVFDCADSARVGSTQSFFTSESLVINIDHHPGNTEFGDINWVDPVASSVGEMCVMLLSQLSFPFTKEIAECLYVSLMTDTGGFRYHLTSYTFKIADFLMRKGADPELLARRIYYEFSPARMKLLSRALTTMKIDEEMGIALISIQKDLYNETGAKEEDTEGIIDILRSVKGIDIACLLKERNSEIKVSLRSNPSVNVKEIAHYFNGGGHTQAAGFSLPGMTIPEAEKTILTYLRNHYGRIHQH
jgi:phosphoesterase RecJ-like protein